MNIKYKSLLAICAYIFANSLWAQKNISLVIYSKMANTPFELNKTVKNNMNQDFKFTRMSYYISGIKITHDTGKETAINTYILVTDGQSITHNLGIQSITNIEAISFCIGIEAPINNADPSLQVSGTPLSYQNPSMHWGWSSGYRFVALEGITGNTFLTPFEMHSLGNANYFRQTIQTTGVNSGNNIAINLDAEYTLALKDINISSGPIHHGVNLTDLKVLQNFRDHVFTTGTGIKVNINQAKAATFSIYPNPTAGKFVITFSENVIAENIVLIDLNGKTVLSIPFQNEISVDPSHKGIFMLLIKNKGNIIGQQKVTLL